MNNTSFKISDGFLGERMIVLPTEAFQEYANHPQVKRLYLTDIGCFPNAAYHYRERKEGIEEYIFIYCISGSGTILLEQSEEYVLHAKEAFCIPRNCGHRYFACSDDPWSILWVHFKGEDTCFYPLDDPHILRFSSPDTIARITFLFDLLFQTLDSDYSLDNFIYITQVLSLILAEVYLKERAGSASLQNQQITSVVHFMYEHLQEHLSLEDLTVKFHFSKSYLCLIFQNYTQHSPMEFFISLKMKEACTLLRSTDLKICEIGQRLGYSDPYYFSRLFHRYIGLSPKSYRKSSSP